MIIIMIMIENYEAIMMLARVRTNTTLVITVIESLWP
jgi:hypothetical protein